jgi:GNAT superfamily N-acetyltransferase
VHQREAMFREMGTASDYAAMAEAYGPWVRQAISDDYYRGWLVEAADGAVAAGAGLVVLRWTPGPGPMDPRLAWVFNVYTEPAHRRRGLGRRLMETLHAWCREQGIERVALNASLGGEPLYEEMGYAVQAEPMMRIRLS